jgi:hypothetical protein
LDPSSSLLSWYYYDVLDRNSSLLTRYNKLLFLSKTT